MHDVRRRRPDSLNRRQRGHLVPLVVRRTLPPDPHRFGVVRARGRDRHFRIVDRIAERLAVRVPVALPAEDAKARNAEPRERGAHEIGHGAEIFGHDLGAGAAEDLEQLLAERLLPPFVGPREERIAALLRTSVGAIEADEAVDAVAVEQICTPPRALAQPAIVLAPDHVPPIDRHPPVLTAGAERIRRDAERDVEMKLVLPRPHIGTVAVDHERQIAEQLDAVRAAARLAPLQRRDPLQVLKEQDLARQLTPRTIDCRGLAALQLDRPVGPRVLLLARVNRAKQAVVLDPPRLLAEKHPHRARTLGVAAPFGFLEAIERRAQRGVLQGAHHFMLDPRRSAAGVQPLAILGGERRFTAERFEIGDARQTDEHRIDRHRADRRVRRLLAWRPLVDRQQLQDALPAAASHAAIGSMSPMSPMPQLVVEEETRRAGSTVPPGGVPWAAIGFGICLEGTSSDGPRRRASVAIEVPQNASDAVAKRRLWRQKAHHEKRLVRKVEKIPGMRKHPIPGQEPHDEILFRFHRRHLEHGVPSAARPPARAARCGGGRHQPLIVRSHTLSDLDAYRRAAIQQRRRCDLHRRRHGQVRVADQL